MFFYATYLGMVIAFEILCFIILGVLAGLLAGLLGLSGGVITVPALFFLFNLLHFPEAHLMHLAIGTSLAAMSINTLVAAISHRKQCLKHFVLPMIPGIILGASLGAYFATLLHESVLKMGFALFIFFVGFYFLMTKLHIPEYQHANPHRGGLGLIGFAISLVASLLGIGGSLFTIPILTIFEVPMKKAIATSAAIGCLITWVGASAYLFLGLSKMHLEETTGYLYLPAFLTIGTITVLVVPLGAKWSRTLPTPFLKKIFGVTLICLGLIMLGV